MIISSSLAFEQMVTLELLDQHEREKGESSNEEEEEEERPRSPAQEPSISVSARQSQAPSHRERQEPPTVPTEQVVQEAAALPPQALPTPHRDRKSVV